MEGGGHDNAPEGECGDGGQGGEGGEAAAQAGNPCTACAVPSSPLKTVVARLGAQAGEVSAVDIVSDSGVGVAGAFIAKTDFACLSVTVATIMA